MTTSERRLHLGFAVADLERAAAFYRVLLGVAPGKTRPGYVRFASDEPPLNLTLHEVERRAPVPRHPEDHFGLEVASAEAVRAAAARLRAAGFDHRVEEATQCCYAEQTKVWVDDPDGNPWEVYTVTDADAARGADTATECCTVGTCR